MLTRDTTYLDAPEAAPDYCAACDSRHQEALGLFDRAGVYQIAGEQRFTSLNALNDLEQRTFPQIADVIEAELALVTDSQTGELA